jgi:SAM-dependent methyltransferase
MSQATRQSDLYLNLGSIDAHLDELRDQGGDLYGLLCQDRCRDIDSDTAAMDLNSWEFEDETAGGRGLAYNLAQKSVHNRAIGMASLLRCFSSASEIPGEQMRILDVLGGDGTFARFCKSLAGPTPTIFTADISKFMIEACRLQTLPCIRQSAEKSLFRDNVLDGVLIAYGSHHLTSDSRTQAVSEAYRVLKVGGRLVLHDFEIGGRSAAWFNEVVHPYSRTGHPHPHFSRNEMQQLLGQAGFVDVAVFEMDDRFTLYGATPVEAKRNAIMHMYDMYDLVKIASPSGETPVLEQYITKIFGPIGVRKEGQVYLAEIPREALVAVGTKPASSTRQ